MLLSFGNVAHQVRHTKVVNNYANNNKQEPITVSDTAVKQKTSPSQSSRNAEVCVCRDAKINNQANTVQHSFKADVWNGPQPVCRSLWHVVTHFSPAAREDLKIVELSSALMQHYHSNCTPTSPHTSNIKHTAVTDSWRLGEEKAWYSHVSIKQMEEWWWAARGGYRALSGDKGGFCLHAWSVWRCYGSPATSSWRRGLHRSKQIYCSVLKWQPSDLPASK